MYKKILMIALCLTSYQIVSMNLVSTAKYIPSPAIKISLPKAQKRAFSNLSPNKFKNLLKENDYQQLAHLLQKNTEFVKQNKPFLYDALDLKRAAFAQQLQKQKEIAQELATLGACSLGILSGGPFIKFGTSLLTLVTDGGSAILLGPGLLSGALGAATIMLGGAGYISCLVSILDGIDKGNLVSPLEKNKLKKYLSEIETIEKLIKQ